MSKSRQILKSQDGKIEDNELKNKKKRLFIRFNFSVVPEKKPLLWANRV
jgi:hypothetical protein